MSLLLGVFGFLKEFRPSEPFVTEFLLGEWRNLTAEQVYQEVYPYATYSHLVMLVTVTLVTDHLRYKPVIVASSCAAIAIYSMLLWTTSLLSLQIVEIFYGFYRAGEVAYFTYMYAKVDKDKYQKVTGNARAAHLSGRFLASVVAQLLYSYKVLDVRELNYLTLGAQIISFVVAVLLPTEAQNPTYQKLPKKSHNIQPKISLTTLKTAYRNSVILRYSFYWILSTAAYMMIHFHEHILWNTFSSHNTIYNPSIEAFQTIFSTCAAAYAGFLTSKTFKKYDLVALTICSLLQGTLAMVSSQATSIWLVYVFYVLYGICYNFMITIATATVANELADDSFALIFGINTFVAIGLQTLLTILSGKLLGREVGINFLVFGSVLIAMGSFYCLILMTKWVIDWFGIGNEKTKNRSLKSPRKVLTKNE